MSSRTPDVRGSFKRYPVPRLLFYLLKKRFLGLMEVREPDGNGGGIYFREGLPSYSDLCSSRDVLGRVLLEWGLISEEAFNRSLELLAAGRGLQGQILLEMGAIDQEGLIMGLRLQLQRKLSRLFSLEDASFSLNSCDHPHGLGEAETLVQVDPLWVIHHGVRNAFSGPRMEKELNKLAGFTVQLRPGFERLRPRFGFNPDELALVTLITRSSLPLSEIQRISNLGQLETSMLIYTLWVTEALIVTGAEGQPVVVRSDSGTFSGPGPFTLAGAAQVDPLARSRQTPAAQVEARRAGQAASAPAAAPATAAPAAPGQAQLNASDRQPGGLLPTMTPHSERGDPLPTIILPPANAPDEAPLVLLGGRPRPDPEQDAADASGWLQRSRAAAAKVDVTTPTEQHAELPPPASSRSAKAPSELCRAEAAGAPDSTPAAPLAATRQPTPAGGHSDALHSSQNGSHSKSTHNDGTSVAAQDHAALIEKTFQQIERWDHVQALGLARGASVQQVREAYFQQVKCFHPDRCSALGLPELTAKAEAIFRRIGEAHTVLSDPARSQEYERQSEVGAVTQQQAQAALKAELAYQKGVLLHRKKHFAEAQCQFAQACQLDPEEGEYLAWIAWCRFGDPLTSRATELMAISRQLEQAVTLSPRNPTCHYFLGEVYLAAGNERRARQCFLQTVELKEDHLDAQRRLRLMQLRQDKRTTKSSGLFGRLRKK